MVVIIIGVSGAGKTTIGQKLAARRGWTFYDADDYHPAANVEKMRRGVGLDDADRQPWLRQLCALIDEVLREGESAVLACSALKESYRARLRTDGVRFVYLEASRALIHERLTERKEHYAKADLLKSQFAALEEPTPEEALVVSADQPPAALVDEIEAALEAA